MCILLYPWIFGSNILQWNNWIFLSHNLAFFPQPSKSIQDGTHNNVCKGIYAYYIYGYTAQRWPTQQKILHYIPEFLKLSTLNFLNKNLFKKCIYLGTRWFKRTIDNSLLSKNIINRKSHKRNTNTNSDMWEPHITYM